MVPPKSWYLQTFSSDLEISKALAKSLEVSFMLHLFQCEFLHVLVLVLDLQTPVSASRQVSVYTICHPTVASEY